MTQHIDFLSLFATSFPIEPPPVAFFGSEEDAANQQDIPSGLQTRVRGRRWDELSMMDWRMIGVSPTGFRTYLKPKTFLYYVPSLLVGGYSEPGFIDWALESIIPFNRHHVPRGAWWNEFFDSASPDQRAALRIYLAQVRAVYWEQMGPANQALLDVADNIWS